MADVMEVGCIGCGGRGRVYSSGLAKLPGFRMRGYADARIEAAKAFQEAYGGDYATPELDRVLEDPRIGAVLICTYHDTHAPLAIKAAQQGKHILLEKPMALTIEECKAIEQAVEKAGVRMALGFKMRFMPVITKVKEKIGTPMMMVGQMMDRRWADTNWAQQPKIGGGNVISQGCHTTNILTYFAGADPVSVYAEGGTMTHTGTDIIDNVVATVRYRNGVVAGMIQGDAGLNPYVSKFFFELFGRDGRGAGLYNRCHEAVLWGADVDRIGPEHLTPEENEDIEGDRGLLRHFAECVKANRPTLVGPREGRIATTIVVKLFESVRTGKPQAIAV
ncbi:MAG: hypothetical protein A3F84_21310 [Candidatus Handelsmanbacteria bacterium RIFCSPLOWO2_12_FULL_64_10]|uniref:Oxidoreductase n=1 Tax=Handelsmanbacteria sp. (strain RIFCSPLOWO2_12_FULL_64_10) TaxID=1817868 RepID=A0A1F6D363_HANXR|nr:MAG: hypothetical protein A3F84_21310 [Candidatus Handelsmanbacteria bacterium RIFCSPLOWO2_12_FULL_64_10]